MKTAADRSSLSGQLASTARQAGCALSQLMASPRLIPAFLILVLVSESVVLFLRASRAPFWYDELLTLHVSSLRPLPLIWKALQACADGMPAGYYLLVLLARQSPADTHVAMRLPSLVGYLLSLLGIYLFVGKRFPASARLVAVLLITLSPFREYALEARSYAALVGLLAMAACCWQRVDEKRFMTSWFTFFLTLAVSMHHLAVVSLACFGIAELTWSFLSCRLRWRIWIACLIATTPFLLSLSILLHYQEVLGKQFWSPSKWSSALSTYSFYLGLDVTHALVMVVIIGLAIGSLLLQILRTHEALSAEPDFSPPEVVLIGGFLFYPILLVALTTLLCSGYTPRYGWPAVLGLVLGSVYLLRLSWLTSSSAKLLWALLIVFTIQSRRDLKMLATPAQGMEQRWARLAELSRGEPGLPVVIGSGMSYLEAATYAPGELRDRLVEVIDAHMAARLVHMDTIDQTVRSLAQFTPLRIEQLALFQAAHPRFLLYSGGVEDWLTLYLIENRYHLRMLSKDAEFGIYLAEH